MHRCSLLVGLSWTGKEWPHGCALCVFFSKSLILSKDKFTSMYIYNNVYIYICMYVQLKIHCNSNSSPLSSLRPAAMRHAEDYLQHIAALGEEKLGTAFNTVWSIIWGQLLPAASFAACPLAVLTGCPWKNCKWRLLKVNQSKRSTKDHKRQKWCFCRCTVVTHQFRNLVVFEPYHGKMIPFIFWGS